MHVYHNNCESSRYTQKGVGGGSHEPPGAPPAYGPVKAQLFIVLLIMSRGSTGAPEAPSYSPEPLFSLPPTPFPFAAALQPRTILL